MLAVILAGGRSHRMRRDKAGLLLEGRSLAQHAVDACRRAGATQVVVVAPDDAVARWIEADAVTRTTLEDPPAGGPVAGIAAGVAALRLTTAGQGEAGEEVLLLACDLPRVAGLVDALLDARGQQSGPLGQSLVPVDEEGWPQYLAGLYPLAALRGALARLDSVRDVSVRRLFSATPFTPLHLPASLLVDVDEPHQALAAGITLDD